MGATVIESSSVTDEVRYLRDRVRRLEGVVEEMRQAMMNRSGIISADGANIPHSASTRPTNAAFFE